MSNKQAKVDVIINNESARKRLAEITSDLSKVKAMRDKAFETGDVKAFNQLSNEYKKLITEAGKFAKQTVDVNAVLKNLSGSSIREVSEAYKKLNNELKDMKRNDPGFAEKQKQVKALKDELQGASGPVTGFSAAWSSAKGVMALAAGVMAGLSGAIGFGKSVIESTGATAREFKAITTGLSWAWDEFKKSIATSDFSNLLGNMNDAITAGREYVNLLADVKKSTRALSITNSELNIEFQKLKVIERDVSKPMAERIAAGKKALDVEMQMTKGSQEVAKKAMDAELLHLRTITKLKDEDIKASVATYNTNKKNLDLANQYNKANENFQAKNSQALSQMQATPEGKAKVDAMRELVKNATPEIKQLAGVMKAMGKTTGEELDAMAQSWVTYNNIESESIQKTARVKITLGRLEKGYLDDTNRDEKAAAKEHEKIVKEAQKTLSQLIAEKDAEIDAAIQAGNIPLAEKAQKEMNSLLELAATYKAVKEEIAKGWDLNQRDQGVIDNLVSIGAKSVKSDSPGTGRLVRRKIDINPGPSEEIVDGENKQKDLDNQIKEAAFATATELNNTVFDIVKNRQQAEFDNKVRLLNIERDIELSNKNLTEDQKDAINVKYAKKEAALRTQAFKKEQNASALQALINGALGITKTFAVMGFTPPAWVAAAALAANTLIEIAVIKSAKPPQYYDGGFTSQDANDKKPVGIVHANEFIGSAAAVRNPSIKRYFDVIDYAQKAGIVSQINLPVIESNKNTIHPGFQSGGFSSSIANGPTIPSLPGISSGSTAEVLSIAKEVGKQIALELKGSITGKWVLSDLEKIQKDKSDIDSATKL